MKIQTERLIIRNLCESDYPEFERTLNDSQKNCFNGGPGFLQWLISQYDKMDIQNDLICFGMFTKTDEKLVGTIGCGKHDDLGEPEIFYFLLPEYRGKGYATEGTKAVSKWALENYKIPYLIGTVEKNNVKSQKVLERCGFEFIENRSLTVHVTGQSSEYKYYRMYGHL